MGLNTTNPNINKKITVEFKELFTIILEVKAFIMDFYHSCLLPLLYLS